MSFHFLTTDGQQAFGGFDWAAPFSNDHAIVRQDGKCGAIDKSGALVVPTIFDKLLPFSNDLSAASLGDRRGYIDRDGEWVIDVAADYVLPFEHGLAPVIRGGKIPSYAVGFQHVPDGGKWGAVDPNGQEVVEPTLSYFRAGESFDVIGRGGKYIGSEMALKKGAMFLETRDGSTVFGPFANATRFVDSKALVVAKREIQIIDDAGDLVSVIQKNKASDAINIRPFSDGFAVFDTTSGSDTVYRIANTEGDIVEDDLGIATPFTSGWSAINRGGRMQYGPVKGGVWGFLNVEGSFVSRDEWTEAVGMSEGVGVVMIDKQAHLVSESGDEIRAVGSWARPPSQGFVLYRD